ncbi:MAG: acetylglutamate kinase [Pseudomonadota bacterium]
MAPQIQGLKQAIPYLRKYRGTRFVIKVGGSLLGRESDIRQIAEGIAALYHVGIHVIVVHGGGPRLESLARELGVEQVKIAGRRVTDAKTLELAKMVFGGSVNTDLVAVLESFDTPAVGLTGLDAGTIAASRRPPVEIQEHPGTPARNVDFGFVGDINEVKPGLLEDLLGRNFVPVIASLAGDGKGQVLNINADTVASKIAVALKAEKYINVTDTPGILKDARDPQSLVSYADIRMVESLRNDGILSGGMLPKAESCLAALRGGVRRAHIINGQEADSLLKEIFTNEGCGTLIVESIEKNGH